MSRALTAATTERIVATIALFLSACGGDGAGSSTGLPTAHTPSSIVATTDTLLHGTVGDLVSPKPAVRVTDSVNAPLANVTVTFAAPDGGSVAGSTVQTDANGVASAGTWTLGTKAGGYRLTATVARLKQVTFAATAVAGAATKVVSASGDLQADSVLALLGDPLVVRVVDKYANPVAGVAVTFSTERANGRVSLTNVVSDSTGVAKTRWSLGTTPGTMTLQATINDAASVVQFTATAEWPVIRSVALASGLNHNCAVLTSGPLVCWGLNGDGQLGDGTVTTRSIAVRVAGSVSFTQVAAGDRHTCALSTTGQAYCWGFNPYGQLGDGTTTPHLTPVPVTSAVRFVALRSGSMHTCGLTATGDVYCWGFLLHAYFGAFTPSQVSDGVRFTSIAVGAYETCGIAIDGLTYCFAAQLRWSPQSIATSLRFVSLSGGLSFMCGLTQAGTAYCWGDPPFPEQLGGGTKGSTAPTAPVATSGPLAAIYGGYVWVCGVGLNRQTVCWGNNPWGVFGTEALPFSNPAPVIAPFPAALSFSTWTNGYYHSCAIATDTRTYCWGGGFDGQLGDGGTAQSEPFHHRAVPDVARREAFGNTTP